MEVFWQFGGMREMQQLLIGVRIYSKTEQVALIMINNF